MEKETETEIETEEKAFYNGEERIRAFFLKIVVVKFLNPDYNPEKIRCGEKIITTIGRLTDFDEGDEDKEGFIVISTPTDYDRIPLNDVRKIYLKENLKL